MHYPFNIHSNHQNGEKCDLCDFDRGMIDGARWAGLSISVTTDLLGDHAQQSLEFTQNVEKNKKQCAAVLWTETPAERSQRPEWFKHKERLR